MLIPCIDLQNGQAVQLVHGRKRELAVADVPGLLSRFREHEWLHLIDLDAAMRCGNNATLLHELCGTAKRRYGMKVRVGGGIRSVARAAELKKWGACQIIIGSAAFKKERVNGAFLKLVADGVGRSSIVVALDTARGRIVVKGWREELHLRPEDIMKQLEPYCAAFLCTDVDREGTMAGANFEWFARLRAATSHPIIAAGGIRTRQEVRVLEKMGMDAAVGMALYKYQMR